VNLIPVVITFGEEPIIPQLCETITEHAVSADAGRVKGSGPEEAVRSKYGLEFRDRRPTVDRRNLVSEKGEAVPDELVNGLNILTRGVEVSNDSLRQLDRLGPAEDDVTYGPTVALCDETAVPQIRAVNESPIQELCVAREDSGVVPSRSFPELVDLGPEAIDLDDTANPRPSPRPLYRVAQSEERVGKTREELVELKYATSEACRCNCAAMAGRAHK